MRGSLIAVVALGIMLMLALSALPLIMPTAPRQAIEAAPPLPQVELHAPDRSIPEEIAAFVGRWEGQWAGGYAARFAVTAVDPGEERDVYVADVVYTHAPMPQFGIHRAGVERLRAEIRGAELATRSYPFVMRLRLVDDNQRMTGQHQRRQLRASGEATVESLIYVPGAFSRGAAQALRRYSWQAAL